jgi:hypothetical protein
MRNVQPPFRPTPAGYLNTNVPVPRQRSPRMISVLVAVLVAALVYFLCVALGLPSIVGIVAAILVLLAGIPSGVYGGGRRRTV